MKLAAGWLPIRVSGCPFSSGQEQCARRFASLLTGPDGEIPRFHVAAGARRVEESAAANVRAQPALELLESRGMPSEVERDGFVGVGVRRDELGQTDGVDQARADAAGKRGAWRGEDRQAAP